MIEELEVVNDSSCLHDEASVKIPKLQRLVSSSVGEPMEVLGLSHTHTHNQGYNLCVCVRETEREAGEGSSGERKEGTSIQPKGLFY